MNPETKTCQNCKQNFVIEPEDFVFYEKIKVPPPTWCPECRMIRRFSVRNESNLFRIRDSATGKEIFSGFSKEAGLKVYEHDYWWSDAWDPMEYGRDYDFSRSFFEQIQELIWAVPAPSRNIHQLINSDYSNNAGELKNCYLCFNIGVSEDSAYVIAAYHIKNSLDLSESVDDELCYDGLEIGNSYRVFSSVFCDECHDVWFSRDCTGCSDCVGCVNLRNKKYHIFNKPYTQEGYFAELAKMKLDTYSGLRQVQEKAERFWKLSPYKFLHGVQNTNVSGDFIHNSKNVHFSYNVDHGENLKYCQDLSDGGHGGIKDSYDFHNWGDSCELMYESRGSGYECRGLKFCVDCWPADQDLEYCVRCGSSSNLFGCVGLRKKSYCIFNKQYSKEDYYNIREKIIRHMNEAPYKDRVGRVYKYGEFFPPEFSPFGYNETVAHDFFPIAEEEAKRMGYNWRNIQERRFQPTIFTKDLPDMIGEVDDSILKEVIRCSSCPRVYRIIPMELAFLRSQKIPLPRLCPRCRHMRRLSFRNAPKFYNRRCTCAGARSENGVYQNQSPHFHGQNRCPNEFITSYSLENPRIVYCEQCYNVEAV